MLKLDFLIFGSGRGLSAPFCDQNFHWITDRNTMRGDFYTFAGGFGSQLTSFQWRHPRPQDERRLAGMIFRPFQSTRQWGRVKVTWALQIQRPLRPEDFRLIEARLGDSMACFNPWGRYPGENLDSLRNATNLELGTTET